MSERKSPAGRGVATPCPASAGGCLLDLHPTEDGLARPLKNSGFTREAANLTGQALLFTPPPLPPAEEAERLLVRAFAKMLLSRGIGSLSDAREWLDDRTAVAAIPAKRFGNIPRTLGSAIEAVDIARSSHTCGRSHFLLLYVPKDRERLAAIAGEVAYV